MNGERQPLLPQNTSDLRFKSYRPLSYEEVLASRNEVPWRRARLGLILLFWAAIAIFLSLVTSLILRHDCPSVDLRSTPTVPPVHMSFTPLMP